MNKVDTQNKQKVELELPINRIKSMVLKLKESEIQALSVKIFSNF